MSKPVVRVLQEAGLIALLAIVLWAAAMGVVLSAFHRTSFGIELWTSVTVGGDGLTSHTRYVPMGTVALIFLSGGTWLACRLLRSRWRCSLSALGEASIPQGTRASSRADELPDAAPTYPAVPRRRFDLAAAIAICCILLLASFLAGTHVRPRSRVAPIDLSEMIPPPPPPPPPPNAAPTVPPRIKLSDFNRIETGMGFNEVVRILGPGWSVTDSTITGAGSAEGLKSFDVYEWRNAFGSRESSFSVQITFCEGAVLRKDQDGL